MARLFIIFLIALLPLRGWSAERMGLPMAHPAPAAELAVPHAMGHDCLMAMQQPLGSHAGDASADAFASSDGQHQGCQACDLCMPLAALQTPSLAFAQAPHQPVPTQIRSAFVSADTARHAKPPIS